MNILEIDGKKAYNVSCTNILVKVGNSQQKKKYFGIQPNRFNDESSFHKEEETMINTVTLVGRLANDVDLRYTRSGTAVGQFRLAVNRTFTNQAGEREADFISCVIWRKAAETLTKYARKGSLIGLTGHIQTRNYDNAQGQRVYVTEVVIENYQLLESKEVSEQRRSNTSTPATFDQPAKEQTTPVSDASNPFSEDVNPAAISDDELPF